MGCDIHLKLEWRYKEPTNKLLRKAEYDEDGNKICDELRYTEHDEWRCSRITDWGDEWSCRTYPMFSVLADVRNYDGRDHLPIRGFPKDASGNTKRMYAFYKIVDNQDEADKFLEETKHCNEYHYAITKEDAEKYVNGGCCEYVDVDGEKMLSCPDWHSANWCSTSELEDCINKIFFDNKEGGFVGYYEEWVSLLGAMKGYEKAGNIECRAVFWFDN